MTPALPTSIEQMKSCLGQLLTENSIDRALAFNAKADDIFVVIEVAREDSHLVAYFHPPGDGRNITVLHGHSHQPNIWASVA